MRYRTLGQTGLFVSELCLGTMTFGVNEGRYAAATGVTQHEADAIFRCAFDAGINFVDTANVYGGGGQSEEITGQAIKNAGIARSEIVLTTKVEGTMGHGPNDGGASRAHIMAQVKESLTRLGTDYIDVYMIHGFDPATPVEETVRAMDDLVTQGHVRYIGVSNWAAWQVMRALGVADRHGRTRFCATQNYYSLAGRDIEREIAPMADAEGLGVMVWSPLASGYLSGKYRKDDAEGRRITVDFPPVDPVRGPKVLAALDAIAAVHNLPVATIAIAWLLHRPAVSSVILGTKRIGQLEDNLKASGVVLSTEELASLDAASALPPEYPAWMVHMHGVERRALYETGELLREDE